MGKNLQHQDSNISLENGNPGCMYSVLHVLHHQRWHRVKKMLPHKRHSRGKHTPGGSLDAADVGEFDVQIDAEMANSLVEERTPVSSPVTKTSMKSRIKAFVTEEVSKRRGKHRRSSSEPIRQQFARTNSLHHVDLSDLDPLPEISSNGKSVGAVHHGDNENSSTKKRRCDICAAMLTVSYLKQSNVNEHERRRLKDSTVGLENIEREDHGLLENKDDASFNTSAHETKRLLEALDIFDMRKEFLLKMLQDPKSPWGQYLHGQQVLNSIKVLTKSVSFPAPASARLKDPLTKQAEKKAHICCQSPMLTENESAEECNEDGTRKFMLTRSGSSDELKSRNENKLVMKRFKILRQKIRHAIKESRKERHRIVMDAVFHKVPYGRRSSKHAKDYESLDLKDKYKKHSPASSCGSDQSDKASLRRTASYNDTWNQYSQLFDDSFNREARHHISERLKMRQAETSSPGESERRASLGRILSLPDLRSSFFFIGEETPSITPMNSTLNVVSRKFKDQKVSGLSLVQESGSQENLVDECGTFNENHETAEQEEKIETSVQIEKPSLITVLDSTPREDISDPSASISEENYSANQQQESSMDSPTVENSTLDIQTMESTSLQHYTCDFLRIPMDIQDNAEFKYVRDILTLAGFSRNEFIGTWHSTYQPVDPSVYEGVKSVILADPNFLSGEEGQMSDHLLLFDLINEVLLEIHDRLFTYFPKPLTCRSHFHPTPTGNHVLEEVWNNVSWYLRYGPEMDQLLDDAVSRDLTRDDGWMNLQFDAECVGIELEDMIFDDLLDELVWS